MGATDGRVHTRTLAEIGILALLESGVIVGRGRFELTEE
jgi:hypothetical protein